jgi:hypothetical protein
VRRAELPGQLQLGGHHVGGDDRGGAARTAPWTTFSPTPPHPTTSTLDR